MPEFSCQPIIDASTGRIAAVELLSRLPLKYGDEHAMLAVDLDAVSCAARMARSSDMPVHANVEWSSILLGGEVLLASVRPGVVIELTERRPAGKAGNAERAHVLDFLGRARMNGAAIALDDMEDAPDADLLIERFRPDIVKVRDMATISMVCHMADRIVAEHIETYVDLDAARHRGADLLQGWLIDQLASLRQRASLRWSLSGTADPAGRAASPAEEGREQIARLLRKNLVVSSTVQPQNSCYGAARQCASMSSTRATCSG